MKKVETQTSAGGILVEYYDAAGNRVRAVHTAGRAASSDDADTDTPAKKKAKRA